MLEKSGVRNQRRDLGVDDLRDPYLDLPARRSLVLTAAHTSLPEAAVEDLPDLAREEVAQGLTGPMRTALSRCDAGDPSLPALRDDLLARLSGTSGPSVALVVADHVHLRRLVLGVVPAVVAAGNVLWYSAYRQAEAPHADVVASLRELYEAWKANPGQREALDGRMREVAVGVVGEWPEDLLDVAV